ncbi:MAG: hypothetical protein KJN64_13600 [Ignavibacteria bacterium]|nr:hypothetical protein [Ignavibacteria bacterium]MBT8381257.1 hypothetical protein [Ignavibacteria bacterium]MBT8391622.1 hypothetical protein [Ignavibacteria bacterium]NNJ53043.1 hypothetical protein [Ignavibacteriaceae bacterium]NNL22015.1 hypothetical protein [Ignavibacteriaceae bacterium]
MIKLFNYAFYILCAILLLSTTSVSQDGNSWFSWPEGLGFSNHLEYSYNTDTDRDILENWLNLDYSKGIFSSGLRLEVFQPNDPDPSISRGKNRFAEIDYIYIKADLISDNEGIDITAGNFYSLFGRGMVLKSYEDRSIRIDNNLLGLRVTGKYAGFVLTGLTGTAANINNERKDIIHAADLEFKGWKPLKVGATVASNIPEVEGVAKTTMASFRAIPSFWNIDIYTEYTAKFNSDVKQNIFNGDESIIGQGFYGNLNFYLGSLSLLGEYKYYDNIAFTSQDGTIFYNTPPSLRQEYTYVLPNRHPFPLNQNNEKGFQLAAGYNATDETYLNAAVTLTETLPMDSYYKRLLKDSSDVETQLKEVYLQAQQDWSYEFTTIAAFAYNEENATKTKTITPILENRFYFGGVNTIKLVLEHQHTTVRTTGEQYYSDVVSIEYLRSPRFNVSVVAELETREPEKGRTVRRLWGFIQAGYKIGYHTDISLLIGTRQAGNICIGGVCRFEPAFKGIELKMLTRL